MAQENSVQVLLYVNLSPFYYNFMADDLKKRFYSKKTLIFLIIYVGNYIFLVHRLKTELDLQRLFLAPVNSCTHWQLLPSPRIWAHMRHWSAKISL
jgi:hypothetical protein